MAFCYLCGLNHTDAHSNSLNVDVHKECVQEVHDRVMNCGVPQITEEVDALIDLARDIL